MQNTENYDILHSWNKFIFANNYKKFKMSSMLQLATKVSWSAYLGIARYGITYMPAWQAQLASGGSLIILGMLCDYMGWRPPASVSRIIELAASVAPYFFYPTAILPTITIIPQLFILYAGFSYKWHGVATLAQIAVAAKHLTTFDLNLYSNPLNLITLGIYTITTFLSKWDYNTALQIEQKEKDAEIVKVTNEKDAKIKELTEENQGLKKEVATQKSTAQKNKTYQSLVREPDFNSTEESRRIKTENREITAENDKEISGLEEEVSLGKEGKKYIAYDNNWNEVNQNSSGNYDLPSELKSSVKDFEYRYALFKVQNGDGFGGGSAPDKNWAEKYDKRSKKNKTSHSAKAPFAPSSRVPSKQLKELEYVLEEAERELNYIKYQSSQASIPSSEVCSEGKEWNKENQSPNDQHPPSSSSSSDNTFHEKITKKNQQSTNSPSHSY